MQLTEKESNLIKELKGQEELCIQKYKQAAQSAKDKQLADLFNELASIEQQHLNTLTQMESGTAPQPSSGGGKTMPTFTATYDVAETEDKKSDQFLCTDMLTMEKHASGLYDTCVFEFKDENMRNALNHIQKEEQEHGKMIYDYMSANKMYAA